MTIFDFVVLLILFLSTFISVMRGLVREVLSLASWVGAFLVAKYGAPVVSSWLTGLVSHPSARELPGTVVRVLDTGSVALSFETPGKDWPKLLIFLDDQEQGKAE